MPVYQPNLRPLLPRSLPTLLRRHIMVSTFEKGKLAKVSYASAEKGRASCASGVCAVEQNPFRTYELPRNPSFCIVFVLRTSSGPFKHFLFGNLDGFRSVWWHNQFATWKDRRSEGESCEEQYGGKLRPNAEQAVKCLQRRSKCEKHVSTKFATEAESGCNACSMCQRRTQTEMLF